MTRILAAFLGGIALVGLAALGVSIVVGVILLLTRLGAPDWLAAFSPAIIVVFVIGVVVSWHRTKPKQP
jgi:hypothetical protein